MFLMAASFHQMKVYQIFSTDFPKIQPVVFGIFRHLSISAHLHPKVVS